MFGIERLWQLGCFGWNAVVIDQIPVRGNSSMHAGHRDVGSVLGVLSVRVADSLRRRAHVGREKLLAWTRPGRSLRLVVQPHPLSENILHGFKGTPHTVAFDNIRTVDTALFDIALPLTIDELRWAGEHRSRFQRSLIAIPRTEVLDLCNDKFALNTRLIELGFGALVPPLLGAPALPCVLKKRQSESSLHTHILRTKQDVESAADEIASPLYFCQHLVRGTSEFATHILCRNGQLIATVTIEYRTALEEFIDGAKHAIRKRIVRCPHMGEFMAILNAIGFEGLCCIDHKTVHGRPQLMEINPRLGGSLAPLFFSFMRYIPFA